MPLTAPDRAFRERRLAVSLGALGDEAGKCERAGRALSVTDALAEAAAVSAR